MDREKVIKELDKLVDEVNPWKESPPLKCDIPYPLLCDALALLKEKEEETTFVYDVYTLPMCKKCGFHPFAGYIPTIKWMKERGYMKCPSCGRSVKWE